MLIVTGSIAYDYIMNFPGSFGDHILPDKIHQINLSFIVNKLAKRRGGTAGNVSYNLGLLKTPHKLLSVAGKDFGEYRASLIELGIDTRNVKVLKNNFTSTGFAMTDKKDNQIWGFFYGATEKTYKLAVSKVAKPGDLVLIGPTGAKGSMSLLRQCLKLKIPYMFDPGFILTQISTADLSFAVRNAAYIIGNDYEINVIKDRVKAWKKYFAGKIVITTLGEKGTIIEADGKRTPIKVAKPTKVVDPSGAGDAWRAGFLAGRERGLDIKTCGQMGAIVASFAVEKYGTQEHTFGKQELIDRYRHTYQSLLKF